MNKPNPLTPRVDTEVYPYKEGGTETPNLNDNNQLELWQKRFWLIAGYSAASFLLLIWGYVILPRNGVLFWLWWPVALLSIGAGGWVVWRQIQQAKQTEVNLQNISFFKKGWWKKLPLGLGLILVIGLALNLFILTRYPQLLRYDSYEYSRMAYKYSQKGYTPDAIRSPGYTVLLAGVYKLAGGPQPEQDPFFGPPKPANRDLQAAWLFQAFLLSLTALTCYGIVGILKPTPVPHPPSPIYWGNPLGLLVAGLVALCPFLIAYTSITLTEIAAAFWLTLAVFFWIKALRFPGVAVYPILGGVSLAWTLQTRPTFIYLPLFALATLIWFARGRQRLWQPLLMAIPLVLFLWPQFAANLETWDEPNPVIAADLSTYQTMVGIYYATYGGLPRYQTQVTAVTPDPTAEPIWERLSNYLPLQSGQREGKTLSKEERKTAVRTESDYFKKYFADYVTANPLEYAGTVGKRLWFMWDQHFVFPYYDPNYFDYRGFTDNLNRFYLIFGLVGLIWGIRRWGRYSWPLWISLVYLTAVNALVRIEFRYTLPGYPLLLVFAGFGFWEFVKAIRIKTKVRWQIVAGTGLALILIVVLSATLPLIPPTNAAREKALDVMAQADERNEVRQFWIAEPLYNQAIEMYPAESQIWAGRGNFFAGKGDPAKAIPDYSKAIALDPQNPDPYRWRGLTYQKLGQNVEARADFEKFLQLAPPNHPARSKIERELKNGG